MSERIKQLKAENAAMKKLADDRLEQMNADRKQYLNAQHRIKVLRGAMLKTAEYCRIWGGEAERARKVLEHYLSIPDNTAELDQMMRDAKQGRDFIELVRAHLTIETAPEIVQAINAIDMESKT